MISNDKDKPLTMAHRPGMVWPCPLQPPVASFFPWPQQLSFLSLVLSMAPEATGYLHMLSPLHPRTLFPTTLLAHLNSFQPFKYQCKIFPWEYFTDVPDCAKSSHSQASEHRKSLLSTYLRGSFLFVYEID